MYIPQPYTPRQLGKDIGIGVIIALVSIPISMGYAQVAGLPVVYGLYGSLLPIITFGLISSSPRFVFGVDAAPAAIVGGLLVSFGITAESKPAMQLIPLITLMVSLWLFIFFCIKADRILKFISQPVMGGFITGIGMTIICMQLPKLFGGTAGTGELPELLRHLFQQLRQNFHPLSFLLGMGTVLTIRAGRRFCPRLPMQPLLMFLGAGLTFFFHIDRLGVRTLPPVPPGLPHLVIPNIPLLASYIRDILLSSMTIATVILSETLLATNNLALKHNDSINTRQEIAGYAVSNLMASLCGCCPVNGSVSRTGIANQFGVTSQVMSLAAGVTMFLILPFGTGFIRYLPVPVLTGIIIAALAGTFEFSLAHRLKKVDTAEFIIFYVAFAAVLLLGTVYGVIIGVLLAAVTFILRQTNPAVDFLGIVPGMRGYYSLTRKGTAAVPIKQVVIYRFSGPLFYANISQFCDDVETALRADTRAVIIDASGIGSIDATAAERLLALHSLLAARKVRFYITGHVSSVNDQLRAFGAMELIKQRAVRAKISFALSDLGLHYPYPADEEDARGEKSYNSYLAEFEWAFGTEADQRMDEIAGQIAADIAAQIAISGTFDLEKITQKERFYSYGYWTAIDEDIFLDRLSFYLQTLEKHGNMPMWQAVEDKLNARHVQLEEKFMEDRSRDEQIQTPSDRCNKGGVSRSVRL